MNKLSIKPNLNHLKETAVSWQTNRFNWSPRLSLLVLANVVLWGIALVTSQLFIPPSYKSSGSIAISGVGSQGKVTLSDSGQVSGSGEKSPYQYLLKVDPRENYRYIGSSEAVLQMAASNLDIPIDDFGEPILQSTENTTIIEFEIDGENPTEAQKKARSYFNAFSDRITFLRTDELRRQQVQTQNSLATAQTNLNSAKQKYYQFTAKSPLKISDQITQLSEQLEMLRVEQANVVAQEKAALAQVQQTSNNLNLSPEHASDSLVLLDDQLFQKSLQQYSDASTRMQALSASATDSNPLLVEQKALRDQAWSALRNRSRELLGRTMNNKLFNQVNLSASGARRDIATSLLEQKSEQKSLKTKAIALNEQIKRLSDRLQLLSQNQVTLERLQQDAKLAESIFLSQSAQLKVNQPDFATSYPPIQLVVEPSLPKEADNSNRKAFLLGVLALSFIGSTGCLISWWNRSEEEPQDLVPENFFLGHPEMSLFTSDLEKSENSEYSNDTVSSILFREPQPSAASGNPPLEIQNLSLEELQEKTDSLYQRWRYIKQVIEEQEEQHHLLSTVIDKLENNIQIASSKPPTSQNDNGSSKLLHLKAMLAKELERKRVLETRLEVQRRFLNQQQEGMLLHQRLLQERLQAANNYSKSSNASLNNQ